MQLKELYEVYTKMTVKCFKNPIFLSSNCIIIWNCQKVRVSDTHVQNFGGIPSPTTPTLAATIHDASELHDC